MMNIEVGKYYRTGDGTIVGPMFENHSDKRLLSGKILKRNGKSSGASGVLVYLNNGRRRLFYKEEVHPAHLVAEIFDFNVTDGVLTYREKFPVTPSPERITIKTLKNRSNDGPVPVTVVSRVNDHGMVVMDDIDTLKPTKVDEPIRPLYIPRDIDGWDTDRFRSAIAALSASGKLY